jgi:2,3-dihydroxyphenylpropionate 1,2-dioxygenase
MKFALACASHSPLLFEEQYSTRQVCGSVRDSFDRMGEFIQGFAPDAIIQFSPDHFHGFHYANMPSFCVGTAARSYGDWKTSQGHLLADEQLSLALLTGQMTAGTASSSLFPPHCQRSNHRARCPGSAKT